ncbi:hypothetical protein MLD38_025379 [Melastoma candidum]|uniref:Uncharacterized protein n=1 Tax=Melastoma candidum TaxID=119954 RepID=A0ACB9NV71_9MYRT|nr:hypothetical protein MLD38_025379 [Melastoma candidum]
MADLAGGRRRHRAATPRQSDLGWRGSGGGSRLAKVETVAAWTGRGRGGLLGVLSAETWSSVVAGSEGVGRGDSGRGWPRWEQLGSRGFWAELHEHQGNRREPTAVGSGATGRAEAGVGHGRNTAVGFTGTQRRWVSVVSHRLGFAGSLLMDLEDVGRTLLLVVGRRWQGGGQRGRRPEERMAAVKTLRSCRRTWRASGGCEHGYRGRLGAPL